MDSLGEPILLGLTEEEQDPVQQLLEPSTRGKRPLRIPDFIIPPPPPPPTPLVLREDKEIMLGTSNDIRLVLETA